MDNSIIKFRIDNGVKYLEIPLEILMEFPENHEFLPMQVVDEDKAMEYLKNYFNRIYQEAYENGASWLKGMSYNDEV